MINDQESQDPEAYIIDQQHINIDNDQPDESLLRDQLSRLHEIIDRTLNKCIIIKRVIMLALLYFTLQLIVVAYFLFTPSQYHYNPLASRYILVSFIQHIFHLFVINQLRQHTDTITAKLQQPRTAPYLLMIYVEIQAYIQEEQIDVWSYITSKSANLHWLSKTAYFIMFIIGNIIWLTGTSELPNWLFVVQLVLGWAFFGIISFFLSIFCLVVPFVIGYFYYARRVLQQRRNNNLVTILARVQTYQNLAKKLEQPCFICLQEYQPQEEIIQLQCNPTHIFHSDCLRPWLETRDSCPVCRAQLQ